jgi:hypothetical protein
LVGLLQLGNIVGFDCVDCEQAMGCVSAAKEDGGKQLTCDST